jgi:sterol desaturase/sphingolipid hydroxylase (fatty acid hydroxylase superfamily)
VVSTFIRDYGWFFVFWSTLILLGAVEHLAPELPRDVSRRRWPVDVGLGVINGLIASSLPILTIASAQWAATHQFGLLNWLAAPLLLGLPLTILGRTFAQYAFHLLSHKVPLLWRLHCVHHCDEHLDATSTLRNHPLELIASGIFVSAIVAILGLSPVVLFAYESIEALLNLLAHGNIRLPPTVERMGRALFFITPALHRIHHSARQEEIDTNYGAVFSIWDHLFGTYRDRPPNFKPSGSDWTRSVASVRRALKPNWRYLGVLKNSLVREIDLAEWRRIRPRYMHVFR